MMLFKLSLKNIKKSFKDYAIYFFTLILGVSIFYVFNAIDSQTVLLDVTENTRDIVKLMTNMLSGVSVFVSIILCFLIIYASRFLIKRRNKEFGIYLTLGMSKRKISMILFFETLIIGVISLFVGLVLGFLLSQLMSLLVANMFEADMTKFKFIFSTSACIKTLIYFGIIYVLVMIFNTINISKCKLIDLLHSNKKSEKVKLKNPIVCIIIFIISAIVLGIAYYLVTAGFEKLDKASYILIPIAMGLISTFFIFWSVSGLILRVFMSMKSTYYKGLNSFVLRQVSSKINTTVFSTSIICIMLFLTICILSSALSLKNSMNKNIEELAPVDVELSKSINLNPSEKDYEENVRKYITKDLHSALKEDNINLDDYFEEYIEANIYMTEELTFGKTLGNKLDDISKQYKFLGYNSQESIMKLSDYNKVAKMYGKDTYSLKENEYLIIADFESMVKVRNKVLSDNTKIEVFGHTLRPKYNKCQDGFVDMSGNHVNTGIIVVSDNIIDEANIRGTVILGNYNKKAKNDKIKLEEELLNSLENGNKKGNYIYNNTRLDIVEASVGLGALVTFIGLYLGIVFLISSAAILALKELSESADNRERYMILRRLGADDSLINKALFRQIGIFFIMPLVPAIIHSIFGLKFSTYILETFGNKGLIPSIIMTAIFLTLIYGGYFLITYLCSKNIIKEK